MKIWVSISLTVGIVATLATGLNFPGTFLEGRSRLAGRDTGRLSTVRMPSDSTSEVYAGLSRPKAVFQFYQRRSGAVCWTGNEGLSPMGDSLFVLIRDIRYHGMLPQTYRFETIEEAYENFQLNQLRIEGLLTDAFLGIANDLKYGRSCANLTSERDSMALQVLQRTLNQSSLQALQSQEPIQPGYVLLKKALRIALDSLTGAAKDEWMSGHSNTLNPLHRTLQVLEINLERRRGENMSMGNRYVLVNIPSFSLDVISGDSVLITSRVIVGAPKTPTPVLSSTIECLVIYPYWHVPRKIAVEEYLPVLQTDSLFLTQHHFEILDKKGRVLRADSINWNNYSKDYFPVVMRQREGPENALGLLKFLFDNPYAVYLHDTNAKKLFKSNYRAYSHGCIRMEKAEEFAHYLVTGGITTRSMVVEKSLQQQQRVSIELLRPINIYVRYYTCEVIDGKFYEYNDIYDLDGKMIDSLYP